MTVLHHLAQAAAVLLLVELLVVLMLFLAVAGGLAFGLHWVLGKTEWAFGKANGLLTLGTKYVRSGTDIVGKPFILGAGTVSRAQATASAIRRDVRARHSAPGSKRPAPLLTAQSDLDLTVAAGPLSDPTVVVAAVPVEPPRG